MGLASQPATAQCKPLPMAPGDNAPDKRLNRPAYRAQPPAARQIRHKPKFNLESGNAEHVKPSHMKPLDNSKFISPHQNLAPKTAGPTIKISLEICSACEIKKWNCWGPGPNRTPCKRHTQVKAKEDHGQVIAKKGSWDIKVKLADQVCDMKRIIFAMGSCDNSDQRSFIATEVSTNGFDNLSPAQMIQSLAIDQLSLNRQGDPIPPDCVMSGSCNALGLSKDSQDENISLGARPVSNDPLPFGNGEPDTRGFKEMTASASKRPELEVPCRSSTMSRPNSSDDLFGTIDNQDRAHGQLKHSILALTNESLSCSPLVWSCTVSQNTETSSDIVLTPTDSSTPFDSATSSTSVASSSVSDSQGSSESGETYSTSNSSNYSTDNLLRDLFSEPTVTEYKRELVDRLMRDLCSTICISELVRSLPVNDGSSNSDSNATSHRSSSSVPKSGETKTKGRNDNKKQKKDGNEDGNSDEENGGRQNSTDFLLEGHQKRRLGCPYFLRSPWKYSTRRTCSGPGWHNARHVRDHLKREHQLPLQCSRCWKTFRDINERAQHLDEEVRCKKLARPVGLLDKGYNEEQGYKLWTDDRKKGQSEIEKWIDIYKILFPLDDDNDIPEPHYKTTLTASSLSEQARFHQEVIRETKRLAEKAIQDFVEVRIGKIEEEAKIEIANILPRAIAEATQACNSSRPLEQTHSKFAQQETAANSLFRPANISSSAKSISLSTPIARRNSAVPASQPFSSSIAQPISMQRRMTTANIREDMAELPGEPLQLLSCSANANTSKALQEQKQGFRTQHGAGFGTQPPLASLQQQSSGFKRLQDSLLQPQMTRNPFRRSVNPSMNAEVPTTVAPSVTKTRSMAKPNLQRESAATISTPQYSPTAHYGPRVVTNQNTPRTQSISGPASTFNSPSMSHTNARQNQIMKTHHSNQRFDTPHELNSNAHFTSQYNQHPSATSRLRQGYYHSAQFDQASSVQTNPNYPVFKPYSNNPQISATQSSLSQHNHNSNLGLQHGQGLSTTERPNELRPQPSWIARAPDLFEDLRNIQMSQDARRGFDQSINEETEQQMAQDGNVEMDFNGDIDFTQDGDFYQGISQDLTLSHDMSQSLFDWDNFESLPRRV